MQAHAEARLTSLLERLPKGCAVCTLTAASAQWWRQGLEVGSELDRLLISRCCLEEPPIIIAVPHTEISDREKVCTLQGASCANGFCCIGRHAFSQGTVSRYVVSFFISTLSAKGVCTCNYPANIFILLAIRAPCLKCIQGGTFERGSQALTSRLDDSDRVVLNVSLLAYQSCL